MKSVALRTLCVSAVFAWFSQIRAYVLMEPGTKDAGAYINEYQNRLVSLVQFLEKINALSKQGTSLPETLSTDEIVKNRGKSEYKDIGRFIPTIDEPFARVANVEKKDYAILPPASEWCRLMGLRGCRGTSA